MLYKLPSRLQFGTKKKLYGLKLHASDPKHLSATAFSIVHEHQKSCLFLVQHGLVGSATALMRPSVEALIRGLWLQWADELELVRFQRGEDSLNPERAIKMIVQRSGVARYNDLLAMWVESKTTLHGYVHHSFQSIIRRSGQVDIPPEEIVSLVTFSAALATHASIELTELASKRAVPGQEEARREAMHMLQVELVSFLDALSVAEIRTK
ncbi:hypothetical protein [Caballeronia sp. GAWG2-1]|uniref:DUF6988 family protein n=1 Tax=Caballeronia sp. GAWG2-1 TaxID=2921744 RepID=UPI0020285647|nr:hypothetical protein [Caballeronia sp. GAWG2-1]